MPFHALIFPEVAFALHTNKAHNDPTPQVQLELWQYQIVQFRL